MLIFIRNLYFHFCFFFFPLPLMTTPQIHLVFHWRGSDPYVGNHWIKLLCSLHWCISINTLLMFTLKFLSLHIFMILLLCVYIVSQFFFSIFFLFHLSKRSECCFFKGPKMGDDGHKGAAYFLSQWSFSPKWSIDIGYNFFWPVSLYISCAKSQGASWTESSHRPLKGSHHHHHHHHHRHHLIYGPN